MVRRLGAPILTQVKRKDGQPIDVAPTRLRKLKRVENPGIRESAAKTRFSGSVDAGQHALSSSGVTNFDGALANAAETERSASLVDLHLHKLASGASLAVRAALGATVAYVIATALGLQHPIYALVAAIIGTEFVTKETTKLGFQQLVATAFGAISGTLIRTTFPSNAASAGLGILISVLACYVTIREGAKVAKIAGYVTAIIILDEGQRPLVHGLFRFIEIALGIAVAWLLSLVPRLVRIEKKQ